MVPAGCRILLLPLCQEVGFILPECLLTYVRAPLDNAFSQASDLFAPVQSQLLCMAIPSACLQLVDNSQLQCHCRGLIPADTAVTKQFHLSDFWIWLNKSFFLFFFLGRLGKSQEFCVLVSQLSSLKRPMEVTTDAQ